MGDAVARSMVGDGMVGDDGLKLILLPDRLKSLRAEDGNLEDVKECTHCVFSNLKADLEQDVKDAKVECGENETKGSLMGGLMKPTQIKKCDVIAFFSRFGETGDKILLNLAALEMIKTMIETRDISRLTQAYQTCETESKCNAESNVPSTVEELKWYDGAEGGVVAVAQSIVGVDGLKSLKADGGALGLLPFPSLHSAVIPVSGPYQVDLIRHFDSALGGDFAEIYAEASKKMGKHPPKALRGSSGTDVNICDVLTKYVAKVFKVVAEKCSASGDDGDIKKKICSEFDANKEEFSKLIFESFASIRPDVKCPEVHNSLKL